MSYREKVRTEILEAGVKIWHADPSKVSARNIAKVIGKTHPSIYHHYPNKNRLLTAVANHAIQAGDSVVIVSLILTNSPLVGALTEEERMAHIKSVATVK